jgi:hypothetical protein
MWTSLYMAKEVGKGLGRSKILQRSLPDEQKEGD